MAAYRACGRRGGAAALVWLPLSAELRRWAEAGRRPRFWLRDDDATAPTPALDRLLGLAAAHGVPVTVAVLPQGERLAALAARLAEAPGISVVQHGTDHVNRRPAGQAPGEFQAGVEPAVVAAALLPARARLAAAFPGLLPVYSPPWNRLQPQLAVVLQDAGILAVTAGDSLERAWAGLLRIDARADLLRWTTPPRALHPLHCALRLARRLADARRAGRWDEALGVITHHLVHDEAAWERLEQVFRVTAGAEWVGLETLLAERLRDQRAGAAPPAQRAA